MTDITELAQREKFEAWFKSSFHPDKTGPYIKDQLYFAWKAAGAELVEALEYYKSREERVTSLVRDNSKSWDELYRQVEAKGKRNVELVEALESEKRICATWRKTAEANSEKLEKAQQQMTESENRVRKQNRHICELFDDNTALRQRIAELESRTVKLPDGWQFEECEIEGCENGAIFSVGTGSRNIHLCDKCAHEPQNSRLKKSPLSKRLPFKMSAGIKVEAE
ncbi:ead/Ea22-like family protein [Klebsiella pneumoniae]|uniref:ead/Ea22-like family protein n=1 Tax=Klebsiella pneumoniae TaxID=573 RepID=UPI0010EF59F7|nr:ead/Ea22-like family protein [Klebsiella pneumoniae]VGD57673.1 RelE family toxin-antitoxin system [Klebsiella pneumoniae]